MVEILFSESAALSRKLSKYQIQSEDEGAFEIENLDRKEALNEDSDAVIYLPFMLDIGDILQPIESDNRKNLFLQLSHVPGRDDALSITDLEVIWQRYLNQIKRLEKAALSGANVRIWYSDAAYSRCGLYQICAILKQYDCEVSVIKLPEYSVMSNGWLKVYKSWQEVSPDEFDQCLSLERSLSKNEIEVFATMWEMLKMDNHALRVVLEGKLIGVSEDFYDGLIRARIPSDEFTVISLIGDVICEYQLTIHDTWYTQRIRRMIEQGELIVVKEHPYFYDQILKKA